MAASLADDRAAATEPRIALIGLGNMGLAAAELAGADVSGLPLETVGVA